QEALQMSRRRLLLDSGSCLVNLTPTTFLGCRGFRSAGTPDYELGFWMRNSRSLITVSGTWDSNACHAAPPRCGGWASSTRDMVLLLCHTRGAAVESCPAGPRSPHNRRPKIRRS